MIGNCLCAPNVLRAQRVRENWFLDSPSMEQYCPRAVRRVKRDLFPPARGSRSGRIGVERASGPRSALTGVAHVRRSGRSFSTFPHTSKVSCCRRSQADRSAPRELAAPHRQTPGEDKCRRAGNLEQCDLAVWHPTIIVAGRRWQSLACYISPFKPEAGTVEVFGDRLKADPFERFYGVFDPDPAHRDPFGWRRELGRVVPKELLRACPAGEGHR
jgi:hypothetical protein